MSLHPFDVVALIGYLLLVITVGVYASRRSVNTDNYFLGGRGFKGLIVGISMVGASISCITFIAYPADAYKTAWLRFLPNLTLPLGIIIASRFFLPFYRRGNITSAYQYLDLRFGPSIRVYGSACFVLGQLTRIAMILYLLSILIQQTTGLKPTDSIIISGVCVALITVVGGLHSVIWTTVIQTTVLTVGGALCIATIIWKLPGGIGQIFSVAIADGKFSAADLVDGSLTPSAWGFSLQHKTVTMMLILGLSNWLFEYGGNQTVIQRYAASKSVNDARKAMWFSAFASMAIWATFMFVGTSLYVFFKQFPATEAADILAGANGKKAELILPFFIVHHLPVGITGLVIAAALSAALSTLNASINSITMVTVQDLYRALIVKGRPDRHYLMAAYVVSATSAVIMVLGAIALSRAETKTLQDTGTILASLMSGGFLGVYLLGFLTTKGDARAVWIGLACANLFTAWTLTRSWLPDFMNVPFDLYYAGIVGHLVMLVVGYLVGSMISNRKRDLTNLTVWRQDATPVT
ncbi:MAG: sodium:solute symporter [Phycisphaerae bacterium]|nr:sodium:solute symporter [Phycisphaerae bacterium]